MKEFHVTISGEFRGTQLFSVHAKDAKAALAKVKGDFEGVEFVDQEVECIELLTDAVTIEDICEANDVS